MSVECNRIRGFTYTMPYIELSKLEDIFGDEFDNIYFSAYDKKRENPIIHYWDESVETVDK